MNASAIVSENTGKSRPVLIGGITETTQAAPAREAVIDGMADAANEAAAKGLINLSAIEPFSL